MQYNKVTPEILAQFEKIVPGKIHTGSNINEDFFRGYRGDREDLL